MWEIDILSALNHVNVVRAMAVVMEDDKVCGFLSELCDTTVDGLVREHGRRWPAEYGGYVLA
jgi:hypothetical protein